MKKPISAAPKEKYREKKRLQIWYAMLELLDKKPLREITVQELCDKCMIYRTTFYNHFYDIYDLISFGTKQIIKEWNIENMIESMPDENEKNITDVAANLVDFIEHYRSAMINMGDTKFREEILSLTNGKIERFWNKILSNKLQENNSDIFLTSKFLCGGLTELIDYWTQDKSLDSETLHAQVSGVFDMIKRCI